MNTKLNDRQEKMLAALPSEFYLEEDFRRSDTPPTIVVDAQTGNEVFRFDRSNGGSKTFTAIKTRGFVVYCDGESVKGFVRRLYFKN